jgi:hypothetical protein
MGNTCSPWRDDVEACLTLREPKPDDPRFRTTLERHLRADVRATTDYVKYHIIRLVRRADEPRPPIWRGASKTDFMAFPPTVQREMGYALFLAQMGERHSTMAKTLAWPRRLAASVEQP